MAGRTARIGMPGYAAVLAEFSVPRTTRQAQDASGIGHTSAERIVSSLYVLGLIHVAGWSMAPGCPTLPMFAAGSGKDADIPATRPNGRPVDGVRMMTRSRPTAHLIAFKSLIDAISSPASRVEVCQATGLHGITVRNTLNALVKHRLAHVAMWQWRDHGGPPLQQYQMGAGKNAPRPAPMTKRQVQLRYLERKRSADVFRPLAIHFGAQLVVA